MVFVTTLIVLTWMQKMQYLPVASALLIGGLTATSITLNQGIATFLQSFRSFKSIGTYDAMDPVNHHRRG